MAELRSWVPLIPQTMKPAQEDSSPPNVKEYGASQLSRCFLLACLLLKLGLAEAFFGRITLAILLTTKF